MHWDVERIEVNLRCLTRSQECKETLNSAPNREHSNRHFGTQLWETRDGGVSKIRSWKNSGSRHHQTDVDWVAAATVLAPEMSKNLRFWDHFQKLNLWIKSVSHPVPSRDKYIESICEETVFERVGKNKSYFKAGANKKGHGKISSCRIRNYIIP